MVWNHAPQLSWGCPVLQSPPFPVLWLSYLEMYITGQLHQLALASRDSGALGAVGWGLLRAELDLRMCLWEGVGWGDRCR